MEQRSVDPDWSPAAGICGLILPVHPRTGSTIHTASQAVDSLSGGGSAGLRSSLFSLCTRRFEAWEVLKISRPVRI